MPEVKIRKVADEDLGTLAEITEKCHEIPTNITLRTEEQIRELLDKFTYFLVAEVEGKIVGFLTAFDDQSGYSSPWFSKTQEQAKKNGWETYLYIDTAAVLEDYRGQGVMKELGKEMMKDAGKKYDAITLDTRSNPPNKPILDFAEKNGWKFLEEFEVPDHGTYKLFALERG